MMKILRVIAIAMLVYFVIGGGIYGGIAYANYRRAQAMQASIRVGSDASALAKLLGSNPQWFWLDFRGDREKCDGMIHPDEEHFSLFYPKDPKSQDKVLKSLSEPVFKEQVAKCATMTVVYQKTFEKAIFKVELSSGLVTRVGPVLNVD